jgi:hypothetical protein
MIGIVEGIKQVFVEWVDVLESRKAVQDGLELFTERFGGKFDLSSVEA